MTVAILLYIRNVCKREVFISATLVDERMLPYIMMFAFEASYIINLGL
jgi:hypothetical protein